MAKYKCVCGYETEWFDYLDNHLTNVVHSKKDNNVMIKKIQEYSKEN